MIGPSIWRDGAIGAACGRTFLRYGPGLIRLSGMKCPTVHDFLTNSDRCALHVLRQPNRRRPDGGMVHRPRPRLKRPISKTSLPESASDGATRPSSLHSVAISLGWLSGRTSMNRRETDRFSRSRRTTGDDFGPEFFRTASSSRFGSRLHSDLKVSLTDRVGCSER